MAEGSWLLGSDHSDPISSEIKPDAGLSIDEFEIGEQPPAGVRAVAVEIPAGELPAKCVSPVEVIASAGRGGCDGSPALTWVGVGDKLTEEGDGDG
jgi:hypothetical protein